MAYGLLNIGKTLTGATQLLPYERRITPVIEYETLPYITTPTLGDFSPLDFSPTDFFVGTTDLSPGQTATAVGGVYTPEEVTRVSFIWIQLYKFGLFKMGTGATYVVPANSPSGALYLQETVILNGVTKVFTSRYLNVVAAGNAPLFTTDPLISADTTSVGGILRATNALAVGTPSPVVTGQFYRDGTAITGATGTSYTFVTSDLNKVFTYRNFASNGVSPNATSDFSNSVTCANVATVTVNTTTELKNAIDDAIVPTVIKVSPGTYVTNLSWSTMVDKSAAPVRIRPEDRSNPPVFKTNTARNSCFSFGGGAKSITFDGLHFLDENVALRTTYVPMGIHFDAYSTDIKVLGCHFDGFCGSVSFRPGGNRVEVGYCTTTNFLIDCYRLYNVNNLWVHHTKIKGSNINTAWQTDTNRHPDAFQLAHTSSASTAGLDNLLFEDNWVQVPQVNNITHGILATNERVMKQDLALSTYAYRNLTVRRNYFEGTNPQTIAIGGVIGATIKDNLIMRGVQTSSNDDNPTIYFVRSSTTGKDNYRDIVVSNNAKPVNTAGDHYWGTGATTGNNSEGDPFNITITGTKNSAAGEKPTNWDSFDASNEANIGHLAYIPPD